MFPDSNRDIENVDNNGKVTMKALYTMICGYI